MKKIFLPIVSSFLFLSIKAQSNPFKDAQTQTDEVVKVNAQTQTDPIEDAENLEQQPDFVVYPARKAID